MTASKQEGEKNKYKGIQAQAFCQISAWMIPQRTGYKMTPSLGNLGTSIYRYPRSDSMEAKEGDNGLKLLNGLFLKVQTRLLLACFPLV